MTTQAIRRRYSSYDAETIIETQIIPPGYKRVELAVSPLLGLGGVVGYHSSILVNGMEFFFEPTGIRGVLADALLKHKTASGGSHNSCPTRIVVGGSRRTGNELVEFLEPHFRAGTYDLLRKNCNSFSDCALFFLCGVRLDGGFCAMERFGDSYLAPLLSLGGYAANPQASGFEVEDIISVTHDSSRVRVHRRKSTMGSSTQRRLSR